MGPRFRAARAMAGRTSVNDESWRSHGPLEAALQRPEGSPPWQQRSPKRSRSALEPSPKATVVQHRNLVAFVPFGEGVSPSMMTKTT